MHQFVDDIKARHAVGTTRVLLDCDRSTAISSAAISDEHKTIFSNPGEKRSCSPHMNADPICGQWIRTLQTAHSVSEMLFFAAMCILCASLGALNELRKKNLLQLTEAAETWECRFRDVAQKTLHFWHTVTRRMKNMRIRPRSNLKK